MRTLSALPAREAGSDRAPDDGDLRTAGRAAGDLAGQVGARRPRLQDARARALPRAGARASSSGAATASPTWRGRSRRCDRSWRRPASTPRSPAARSTSSASGRRCSASTARDLRRLRDPHPRRRREGLLRGARRRALACGARSPASSTTTSPFPKANDYRSLHTAVIALDGRALEIQIRTHAMHQVSEFGVAAHWRYKEGGKDSRSDREYDAKLDLAARAHGLAARRQRRDRVRRGHQARHLPRPGLRVHAQGRGEGPAGGLDAARLRVPDPHRRRPPDDRRQGQQPPGPARLQAPERRHRRDPDDEGRARPVARLAGRRQDQPRQGKDPPVVQAQGPRREHRPRPRRAGTGAATAGAQVDRRRRPGTAARHGPRPTTSTTSTTSTRRSATARSARRPS